ncbi:hypothetical protein ABG768_024642 [Culter alburnus]|uniref:C-type lectin domain-containing protein n=1 Tax=Culter alburnus TaxID=194366 RepID=A0AAW2ADZ8_CULAL
MHFTDLATIDDHMDLSELLRSVHQDYKGRVWIGLHRKDAKAPWIWSDQSKSTFMPWVPGQPNSYGSNQYCVVVADGALNDVDCQNKLPSVCHTEKRKQTVRLTVKSSQNINDPSVKAEILLKIEQILKEKGLTEDAKLLWKIQSDGNVFQKNRKCDVTQQTCFFIFQMQ